MPSLLSTFSFQAIILSVVRIGLAPFTFKNYIIIVCQHYGTLPRGIDLQSKSLTSAELAQAEALELAGKG